MFDVAVFEGPDVLAEFGVYVYSIGIGIGIGIGSVNQA